MFASLWVCLRLTRHTQTEFTLASYWGDNPSNFCIYVQYTSVDKEEVSMYALQFSGRQSKQDLEKSPIHIPESLVCGSNFSGPCCLRKRGVDYILQQLLFVSQHDDDHATWPRHHYFGNVKLPHSRGF